MMGLAVQLAAVQPDEVPLNLGVISNGTFYAKSGLGGTWLAEATSPTQIAVGTDAQGPQPHNQT